MKLKKGDVVQLTSNNPRHGFGGVSVGDIGVVLYGADSPTDRAVIVFQNHASWGGYIEELKKVDAPLRRFIKYSARLVAPDFKEVEVVITAQGLRGHLFGGVGVTTWSVNPLRLASSSRSGPCFYSSNTVFVRGNASKDENTFILPLDRYAMFKQAVIAYNEHFSGDNEKIGPRREVSADGETRLKDKLSKFVLSLKP